MSTLTRRRQAHRSSSDQDRPNRSRGGQWSELWWRTGTCFESVSSAGPRLHGENCVQGMNREDGGGDLEIGHVEGSDYINRVISVEFQISRESGVSRGTCYCIPNLLVSGKTRCAHEARPKKCVIPRRYKFEVNLAGSVPDPHTRTRGVICLAASLRSQGTVGESSRASSIWRESVPAAA
jgi:hypothetical protein